MLRESERLFTFYVKNKKNNKYSRFCIRKKQNKFYRGYAGRYFKIKLSNGLIFETEDLWQDYHFNPHQCTDYDLPEDGVVGEILENTDNMIKI